MADINVERKGPSIWPWIIGLLVLALLIWAIAEMVDTDEEVAVEPVEEVEEPVAAVPTPEPVTPEAEMEAVELETLAPLGSDDVGRTVMIDGRVVGQPTSNGFWVATAVDGEPHAIFVHTPARTRDGRMLQMQDIQSGQNVEVMGTLQQAPAGQASTWIEDAQLRQEQDFQQWNVHQDLMLSSAQAGQPGMQPQPQQPGMQPQQPAQPGDTVQGRY